MLPCGDLSPQQHDLRQGSAADIEPPFSALLWGGCGCGRDRPSSASSAPCGYRLVTGPLWRMWRHIRDVGTDPRPAARIIFAWRTAPPCRAARSRFNSVATSSSRPGGGASRSRSRRLASQRRSVDSPMPRSSAISFCVRPLVSTRRTASASNSFPNRCCGLPMKCSGGFNRSAQRLAQGYQPASGSQVFSVASC
mgnify:CR=1 FL=1